MVSPDDSSVALTLPPLRFGVSCTGTPSNIIGSSLDWPRLASVIRELSRSARVAQHQCIVKYSLIGQSVSMV